MMCDRLRLKNYGKCMVVQMAKKPLLAIDERSYDDERLNKPLAV
jgi:hypothetical protein